MPGADADSETPRSRESFEDFTRRLGGLDPLEGTIFFISRNFLFQFHVIIFLFFEILKFPEF